MEAYLCLKVSSERLQKRGIKPVSPGLQNEWLNLNMEVSHMSLCVRKPTILVPVRFDKYKFDLNALNPMDLVRLL